MALVRPGIHLALLLALLVIFGFAAPINAQELDDGTRAALDTFIAEKMQELSIPGVALAVVRGDEIAYMQGYGIAAPDGRAVTPQTPFLLASLSKSFTGLAIMQLIEAGLLNLDDTVQQHVEWFRPDDSPPMTVSELLYHTSGFSLYDGTAGLVNTDASDTALENHVRRLSEVTLQRPVGESFEYSNANYDVLGYLVQLVSGQSFEAYVQEKILTPLDMNHSHLSPGTARANGMSSAFYPFFGGYPAAYEIPFARGSVPSAEIIASAEDMARYLIAHLNRGQYAGSSILSPESVETLHAIGLQNNPWGGYAMGWNVYPLWNVYTPESNPLNYTFPAVLEHEGTFVGFRSQMLLVPQENLGVVALMNTNNTAYESAYRSVAEGVTHLLLGYPAPPTVVYEDWLRQNGLAFIVTLLLIQFIRMLWSVINLRRWRQTKMPSSLLRRILTIVIPAALDLILAYVVLFALPATIGSSFEVTIQFAPDLGILALLMLIITLGWGTLRTILYLLLLRSTKSVPKEPRSQPAAA